jgi:hypothetical protein
LTRTGLSPFAGTPRRLTGYRHERAGTQTASISEEVFDCDWYLAAYPDVAAAGIDPFKHYMAHGKGEGRYPRPAAAEEAIGFDRDWYLASYPDVAAAGIDPFANSEAIRPGIPI